MPSLTLPPGGKGKSIMWCHFSVLWPFGIPQTNWYGRWAVKHSELYCGPSIQPSEHLRCGVPLVTCARPIKWCHSEWVFRLPYHLYINLYISHYMTLYLSQLVTWPHACWPVAYSPTWGCLVQSYGWCRINLTYNLLSFQPLTMQLVSNPKVNLSESPSFQLDCNQGNHPLVKTGHR